MKLDTSPEALFQPGDAADHFRGRPDADAARLFDAPATFALETAWWLAELARLSYRKGAEEGVSASPTRGEILARVGLREELFLARGSARAMVVRPIRGAGAVLAFRGTDQPRDWLANVDAMLAPTGREDLPGLVHKGFREAFESVRDELEPALSGPGPWLFTGHSLGAALATLAAARHKPAALYTFGSPRVGTGAFAAALGGRPVYRIVNARDVVTSVPLPLAGVGFEHLGELIYFTTAGELRRDPPETAVVFDRLLWERAVIRAGDARAFTDLPKFLTDHAAVNYTTLLLRALRARQG